MKRFFIFFVLLSLLCIGLANEKTDSADAIKGFRNLTWDMTPDDAKKVYADFGFVGNSVGNAIYKRSSEDLKIGETNFDEIRYSFKEDKFNKVIAIIESNQISERSFDVKEYIGKSPTINFDKLKNILESKYGPTTQYKEEKDKRQYGIDPFFMTQKKAEWSIGESRIVLELRTDSTMAFLEKNKGKEGKYNFLSLSIEHIPSGKLGF